VSDPKRIGEGMSAETMETLRNIGDGKVRPTDPTGRMRYCTRCERLSSEMERHDPRWLPPLAHSWSSLGHVYWTDRCKPCLEFEKRQREAVAKVAHNGDGSPRPVLGVRPYHERGER
jgi:hypothetical protein